MEKKILIYASVASMIEQFNMENIKLLEKIGYEVSVACNFNSGSSMDENSIDKLKENLNNRNIAYFNINIPRNIFNIKALFSAFYNTNKLLKCNRYQIIHCHSPIGGFIVRLANRFNRSYKNTRVIYTAHGFHFFKGNSLIKNFIFYTLEKLAAKFTDIIITINSDDYNAARKFRLKKGGSVIKIPGVGIDTDFYNKKRDGGLKRKELGFNKDDFLILSVGELNRNKNQQVIIKAMSKLDEIKIKYVLCGQGNQKQSLQKITKELQMEERVFFLGYRTDVSEICNACDIFAFPSIREGLGIAAIEAMAAGLPIITSNRGGIKEYSIHNETGYILDPFDVNGFSNAIYKLYCDREMRLQIGKHNREIAKRFDIKEVNKTMRNIYKEYYYE